MELFEVIELDGNTVGGYLNLTYSTYREKLARTGRDAAITAVGARAGGNSVGLVLAEIVAPGVMSVISVSVEERSRARGVCGCLISKLEEIAAVKGIKVLIAEYAGQKAYTPVIEHLLVKKGWSGPFTKCTVYRCSSKVCSPGEIPWWMEYSGDGFTGEIVKWEDVPGDCLQDLKNSAWLPKGLSPFINENMIDGKYSLALSVEGKLAGWIIYHRIRKDTTVCRSLFLRDDMRDKGYAPLMVIRSVKLQYEDGIENFMFTIHNNNEYVMPMVKRWMERFLVSSTEWWRMEKVLQEDRA